MARRDEPDESVIRDFLLGETPEGERDSIEERLLTDPGFSETVSAMEEELIDAYTAGLLSRDERHLFETRFVVTEDRRRRIRFSEALGRARVAMPTSGPAEKVSSILPSSTGWRRWIPIAAAAVAVVSLTATLWMSQALRALRDDLQLAEQRLTAVQQRREALIERHRRELEEAEEILRAASRPPAARTSESAPLVGATLSPGAFRDAASRMPSLRTSPSTLLIELRLELAQDLYESYTASVHDASGNETLRIGGLRAGTTATEVLLVLQIPAAHLPPDDYSVRLWGESPGELEEVDRYYVRVLAS